MPPRETISPTPNSDDEDEIARRKKKRLENLEEARRARRRKRVEPVTQKGRMVSTPLGPSSLHSNIDTQSLLAEMDRHIQYCDRMYSFRKDIENRPPYEEDEDPDATQLPPGYEDYTDSQPIL